MKRFFLFLSWLSTSLFSADVLIFSFNRPLQLYAFLESFEQNVLNYEKVAVIYRTQGERYHEAYNEVFKRFPFVIPLQQGPIPKQDFKPLLLEFCFPKEPSSDYCVFAVDDIVIKNRIDLKKDASLLDTYQAYGFFYRLGRNINYCYMLSCPTLPPKLYPIESETAFLFSLKQGKGDWCYPNNLDFTLYEKKALKKPLLDLEYHNPYDLESKWSKVIHPNFKGICLPNSKIVNFPMNQVNFSHNKFSRSYTTQELLEKFLDHQKMKIDHLKDFEHHSPHVDYDPIFEFKD